MSAFALLDWLIAIPTVSGLLALALPKIGPRLGSLILLAAAAAAAATAITSRSWPFAFETLVFVLSSAAFLLSPHATTHAFGHASENPGAHRAYYLLLGLFSSALVALAAPWPLLYLWVAVEATTLASVALVALPSGFHPFEAAWKYLMLAGMGGLIALGGILLLDAGGTAFASVGAVLMLVGFGAKAGLVPFHTWLPDAHSQAPAPVSGLLSGAELAGIMWVLQRGLSDVARSTGNPVWPHMALIGLGIVSMLVGIGAMSAQGNVKRFLAYSSIEHMGIIAIGFGVGGVALLGAMLHVITHGLAKGQSFLAAGMVQERFGSVDGDRIGGLHQHAPWSSGGLALGLAALAGVPPLGPFWSEWLIVGGSLANPATRIVGAVLVILLVLGFLSIAYRAPRWWVAKAHVERPGPKRERIAEALTPLFLGLLGISAGIAVPALLHWPGLVP